MMHHQAHNSFSCSNLRVSVRGLQPTNSAVCFLVADLAHSTGGRLRPTQARVALLPTTFSLNSNDLERPCIENTTEKKNHFISLLCQDNSRHLAMQLFAVNASCILKLI